MGEKIKNCIFPKAETVTGKIERSSGIELYRIITMLLIVAHHYVVNSKLNLPGGPIYGDFTCWQSTFLMLFGAWGKTGINCFVLITGYFMCESNITWKKFAKLLLEIYFYRIVLYVVFLIAGHTQFSVKDLPELLLPFTSLERNFVGCYLVFYLCIPFLNILTKNMQEKEYLCFLALLLGIYVIFGSIPKLFLQFNYVGWFCVLYFIGAYLRKFPKKFLENTRLWGFVSLGVFAIACLAIVGGIWGFSALGISPKPWLFLYESNKILSVMVAVSSFLFFKNLKLAYSPFINGVAKTTFGVLLIHSGSEVMRNWLWEELLHCEAMFNSRWLVAHAICSVLAVFVICSAIDMLRIQFLEKPLFDKWEKK